MKETSRVTIYMPFRILSLCLLCLLGCSLVGAEEMLLHANGVNTDVELAIYEATVSNWAVPESLIDTVVIET